MKYKIKWYSKETGATGEGKPVFNTSEMAEYTVDKLNKKTPFIRHWYVAVWDVIQEASDS